MEIQNSRFACFHTFSVKSDKVELKSVKASFLKDAKLLVLGHFSRSKPVYKQYESHIYSENSMFKLKLSDCSHNQPLIFSHL